MTSSLENLVTMVTTIKTKINKMEEDRCVERCPHDLEQLCYQLQVNADLIQRGLLLYIETIKDHRRASRRRYKKNRQRKQEETKEAMQYLADHGYGTI